VLLGLAFGFVTGRSLRDPDKETEMLKPGRRHVSEKDLSSVIHDTRQPLRLFQEVVLILSPTRSERCLLKSGLLMARKQPEL
jgi:hypothetical protein